MKTIKQIIAANPRTYAIFSNDVPNEFDHIEILAWGLIEQADTMHTVSIDNYVIGLSDLSGDGKLVDISEAAPIKNFLGYLVTEAYPIRLGNLPEHIRHQLRKQQ